MHSNADRSVDAKKAGNSTSLGGEVLQQAPRWNESTTPLERANKPQPSGSIIANHIVQLQRNAGNRAVQQFLLDRLHQAATMQRNAAAGRQTKNDSVSSAAAAPVIQRYEIKKGDVDDELWGAIEQFDEGFESFDTKELERGQFEKLLGILREYGKLELVESIQKDHMEDGGRLFDRSVFQNISFQMENVRIPGPASDTSHKSTPEPEGPSDERLNEIWRNIYGMREKEYKGNKDELRVTLTQDPVVRLLFTPPEVFLEIIGLETMGKPRADSRESKEPVDDQISVELILFGSGILNVHTSFPNGMQHTNIGYNASSSGRYTINEVHRHRSMKNDGAPNNAFLDMIKEQAGGVAKLGAGVSYHSDAIRDRDSNAFGYNVWPKLGFDGDIPESSLANMLSDEEPKLRQGVEWLTRESGRSRLKFSDIFTVEDKNIYHQLKELWRKHGDTVKVEFDYSEGSPSWRALDRYERGSKEG